MNALNYAQTRPGGGAPGLMNRPAGRMLMWMKTPKAIGQVTAMTALLLGAGCGSTAESGTVPMRTVFGSPAPIGTSPGLVVAQDAPVANAAPTVEKRDLAAPNSATNPPVISASAAAAADSGSKLADPNTAPPTDMVSTNVTPAIKEEVPPALPENLKISPATEKIIKLAEGGVEESVMLAFVEKAQGKFDLEADEIVYLTDLGVPSPVLTAMLKHDGVDPSKAEIITAAKDTESAQPTVAAQPQPQQQPIEITTNYVPNYVGNAGVPTTVVQAPPPQTVVVQQPQTVVVEQMPETVSYFYSSLSPYGSWMYVSDFGWCWQPTVAVVDHGWRPYGPRGHWVWTTSGWYWGSDYTWGWAPFHYGRWHLAGARGWLWVPDNVWGPAWVSWRTTPDYCGWAPLPPAARFTPGVGFSYFGRDVGVSFNFGLGADMYCFAPVDRFHDRHVYNYALPPHRAHTIYTTSIVNNRYEWGRDHRIVNVGVPRERIERATNRELRPAQIRDVPPQQANRFGPREHVEHNGRETVIYRPEVPRADMARAINRETSAAAAPDVRAPQNASVPNYNNGVNANRENWRRDRTAEGNRSTVTSVPTPNMPAPSAANAPAPATIPGATRGGFDRSRAYERPTMTPPTATPAPTPNNNNRYGGGRDGGGRREFNRGNPNPPGMTSAPPDFSRRDVAVPQPNPSVSNPRTVAPAPQISSPAPRISSPAPQIVSPPPRVISPPSQTVAPPPRIVGDGYRSAPPIGVSQTPPPSRATAPSSVPHVESPRVYQTPRNDTINARPAGPSVPVPNNNAAAPAPSRRDNSIENDVRNRFGRR